VAGFDETPSSRSSPTSSSFLRVRIGAAEFVTENTKVNVNTAPPEVLAAGIADIDSQAARRFVEGAAADLLRQPGVARSRFDGSPLPANLLSVGRSSFW
jgi:hypothetical protein